MLEEFFKVHVCSYVKATVAVLRQVSVSRFRACCCRCKGGVGPWKVWSSITNRGDQARANT